MPRIGRIQIVGKMEAREKAARVRDLLVLLEELRWDWRSAHMPSRQLEVAPGEMADDQD